MLAFPRLDPLSPIHSNSFTLSTDTAQLLERWHAGDRSALDILLERDLPWIREQVRRRLGPLLRARAETDDYLDEAVVDVLRYAPRFLISDRAQFRALLARIVENTLRDESDRWHACRRALHRERPLPGDSALTLHAAAGAPPRPSEVAQKEEWEGWVRLGLEFLDTDDRQVILMRNWDDLPFAEIAARLAVSEDAARMRFHRAVAHLAARVTDLRAGRLREVPAGEEDRV